MRQIIHFVIFLVLTFVLFLVLGLVSGLDPLTRTIVASLVTIVFSVGFDIRNHAMGYDIGAVDFVADALGVGTAFFILLLI